MAKMQQLAEALYEEVDRTIAELHSYDCPGIVALDTAEINLAFAEWIITLPFPPVVIMIFILLGYAVLGMFMDAIGMLLLTLPVVYPAVMALGYDPIWFGIIVVKMCEVCLITPPIGLNCFVVNAVRPDIPLGDVFRGIAPFFVADVITIGLFLAFPGIILWLPNLVSQ